MGGTRLPWGTSLSAAPNQPASGRRPLQIIRCVNSLPWMAGLCITFLGILYSILFQKYRAYEIDNPWYLSFSRSYWVDRYPGDLFLNGVFPNGMGGTAVFGRLPGIIQGAILSHFDWQPVPAMLISSALVLAGVAVWYKILRQSGMSATKSSASILALGLTEPFVGMADRFRFEPFAFFFLAVALWLAASRRPFLALLIALLALETEPAAVIIFCSVLLFLLRTHQPPASLAWKAALAGICFACFYLFLHADIFQILHHTDWQNGSAQREFGGFLRAYFIQRKRHLPELVLFALVVCVYFKKYAQAPCFVHRMAEVAALVCVFSFVMNWPTTAYMAFFFPPALVVSAWCIETRLKFEWSQPIIVAALMFPQYAAVAYINAHEGYRTSDLAQVAAVIRKSEADVGLNDARIMGDYSLWFAHPANYRALASTTLMYISEEDLFLCFDRPIRPSAMVDPIVRYCTDVTDKVRVHEIDRVTVRGHLLHVLAPLRASTRQPPAEPKKPAVASGF
jgi:hypothetical protein